MGYKLRFVGLAVPALTCALDSVLLGSNSGCYRNLTATDNEHAPPVQGGPCRLLRGLQGALSQACTQHSAAEHSQRHVTPVPLSCWPASTVSREQCLLLAPSNLSLAARRGCLRSHATGEKGQIGEGTL